MDLPVYEPVSSDDAVEVITDQHLDQPLCSLCELVYIMSEILERIVCGMDINMRDLRAYQMVAKNILAVAKQQMELELSGTVEYMQILRDRLLPVNLFPKSFRRQTAARRAVLEVQVRCSSRCTSERTGWRGGVRQQSKAGSKRAFTEMEVETETVMQHFKDYYGSTIPEGPSRRIKHFGHMVHITEEKWPGQSGTSGSRSPNPEHLNGDECNNLIHEIIFYNFHKENSIVIREDKVEEVIRPTSSPDSVPASYGDCKNVVVSFFSMLLAKACAVRDLPASGLRWLVRKKRIVSAPRTTQQLDPLSLGQYNSPVEFNIVPGCQADTPGCRKSRSCATQVLQFGDKCDLEGVYARPIKDKSGTITHYKYEPRFKPPRERVDLGTTLKFNCRSLGQYNTPGEAKIVRRIAAFYYGKDEGRVEREDGSFFSISQMTEHEKCLTGKVKAKWVTGKAKEVYETLKQLSLASKTGAHSGHGRDGGNDPSPSAVAVICSSPGTNNKADEFAFPPDVPSSALIQFTPSLTVEPVSATEQFSGVFSGNCHGVQFNVPEIENSAPPSDDQGKIVGCTNDCSETLPGLEYMFDELNINDYASITPQQPNFVVNQMHYLAVRDSWQSSYSTSIRRYNVGF